MREAACACIGELCEKVDRAAVEPHVPTLLHALLVCFNDESWPCRDAAAAGSAALASSYPTAAGPRLPELWRLWLEHLADNVPSVRETAAMAIGKVAAATPEDSRERVEQWLRYVIMTTPTPEPPLHLLDEPWQATSGCTGIHQLQRGPWWRCMAGRCGEAVFELRG